MRAASLVLSLLVLPLGAGCSSEEEDVEPGRQEIDGLLAMSCSDALDSVYGSPSPDGWSLDDRGKIANCAYEEYISVADMEAFYARYALPVPTLTTGAHKLRVSYFIDRDGAPALTSGIVYIPSERRGSPSPVLINAHGAVGLGDRCAPSLDAPGSFESDWKRQVYGLIGAGWVLIQPDFPGLGTPGVTSWLHGPDEGRSILDASRAIRDVLIDDVVSDDNVIVGHSNGGHAALAALAYADDYGVEGTLREVVVYNPLWISLATFGALAGEFGNPFQTPRLLGNSMMYFYGHLDLYEGPDNALDAFLPQKREAAADFLDQCWQQVVEPGNDPEARLGATVGPDIFTEAYTGVVSTCATDDTCDDPLAATWRERWVADRPGVNAAAPLVYWLGGQDDFLTAGFQTCGIDRLEAQGADMELCVDAEGGHSSVVSRTSAWLDQHLANLLLGGPAAPTCAGPESLDYELSCILPLPNSTDPMDP